MKTSLLALAFALFSVAAAQSAAPVGPRPTLCEAAAKAGVSYTPDGYLIVPEDVRTDVAIKPDTLRQMGLLRAALARNGVQLIPVVLPLRGMIYPGILPGYSQAAGRADYQQVLASLRAQGFLTPDLLTYALQHAAGRQLYRKLDGHLIGDGAHMVAAGVAEALRTTGTLSGVAPVAFATTVAIANGASDNNAWSAYANALCGHDLGFGLDHWTLYGTAPVQQAGLLDDVPPPDVVLAGTSQSGDAINLGGELRTALGTDLLNAHIDGGGIYSSLLNYLTGPDYAAHKPKIILWEWNLDELFAYRDDAPAVDDTQTLTEMQAAANGPCAAPLWTASGAELHLPALPGSNYIEVTSTVAGQRTLRVQSGKTAMALTLPNRLTTAGHWYNLLADPSDGDTHLMGDAGAILAAKICRAN